MLLPYFIGIVGIVNDMISWMETHDKLAGWAQFFGAVIALGVTYFTAFAPRWRQKRQLRSSSERLLAHGYEVLESFHRTSAHFLPQAINLKGATLSMRSVICEMNRFPIYELDDQGSYSMARRLVAMSITLEGTCLMLDEWAERLGVDQMSSDDRDFIRQRIGQSLETATALLTGAKLKRPVPSDFFNDQKNA